VALVPRLVGAGYLVHMILMYQLYRKEEVSHEFPYIMALVRTIELLFTGCIRCSTPDGFSNWSMENDIREESERKVV
jgi:hypothetical protein